MKKCTRCKKEKLIECFGKDKSRKNGLNVYCKECVKEIRAKNKQNIKIGNKKYYETNKDVISIKSKQRYIKNKDKVNAKNKQYYINNKNNILEYNKIYYQENKAKISEYSKNYYKENIRLRIVKTLRSRINKVIKGKI